MSDRPIPLRLKLAYATEEEFLAKYASSLSRGGVFVATKNPKPLGTQLAFQFVLSNGTAVLSGQGSVVRSIPPGGEAHSGMTLRFTALDPHSRALIDRAQALKSGKPEAPPPSAPPAVKSSDRVAEERHRRRLAVFEAGGTVSSSTGPEPILGIDLGTTICRAAVHQSGQVKLLALEGRGTALPSYVAFDEHGRLLLGTRAKAQLLVDPRSAIFGTKRLLGRRARAPRVREMAARFPYEIGADEQGDVEVRVQDQKLSPVKIASFLLSEIRNQASDALARPLSRAVLAIPAYFNDRQQHALRQAAHLAGLSVERIITEPAAVGIAYGHGRGLARKRLLIYDLGGGTFDASIIEATGDDFSVLAAGGDNFLGGLDFDQRLATWLEQRFCETENVPPIEDPLTRQRIHDAAETAKIALSEQTETLVHVPWVSTRGSAPLDLSLMVTRAQIEELTEDLVARTMDVTRTVLDARHISAAAVDEVIFVGGQSQAPRVHAALQETLGRNVPREVDPHNAVAIGAALVGHAIKEDDPGIFAVRFNDVLGSSIGIALADGSFSAVLERNTALPCERTCTFPAGASGALKLAIYQGESALADENEYLGMLQVETDGRAQIPVVFSVSRDGLLSLFTRSPEGERVAATLATADASDEVRRELLASAPLPEEEHEHRLLGGIKKLFGRH
jgi:molecular chaperone DnaK